MPLAKVQSLRVEQGPIQRRLKVGGLSLDVAGRDTGAVLVDRDIDELPAVTEELITKCRLARTKTSWPL